MKRIQNAIKFHNKYLMFAAQEKATLMHLAIILKKELKLSQSPKRIQIMLSRIDNRFDNLPVDWAVIISGVLLVPHLYLLKTHDRIMWHEAKNINPIGYVVGERFKEYYSILRLELLIKDAKTIADLKKIKKDLPESLLDMYVEHYSQLIIDYAKQEST